MKAYFHYISYLQYPLILVALYFAIKPYLHGIDHLMANPELTIQSINSFLIFMGLGISFSSLRDITKSQIKFSERIWKNPVKGKITIAFIGLQILVLLTFGLNGYYAADDSNLKDLSIGFIVLGLGMFGFLKTAIEMFEHHRNDKN